MAGHSPDYKALFLEERRRREQAEAAQKEEQRRREEEQRKREEAEHAQERAEERTRKTTLPEFLDACHTHLHAGLAVQPDAALSTRGDPANANNKLRPERLRVWETFPAQQAAIWGDLMEPDFILERLFTSQHALEEAGEVIRRRMLGSELDLHMFQRSTVEDRVSSIIERLYDERTLRRKFGLQGSVKFENHANTLSPESQLQEGIEQMTVSGNRRRRSPRLAKAKETQPAHSTEPTRPVAIGRAKSAPSSRPRTDQFCVYNTSTHGAENRVPAFVIEYKAPHKLSLGYIYKGLEDGEVEDVIRCKETDTPRDQFRRLIAAVITQAFSYMMRIGLEYGCVCTGEATIFLRIPDDPRTVYYFLSVPKGDVGESTGWTSDSAGSNRLHLTAVGQMLAFTLRALQTPTRSHKWRTDAASRLPSWEVLYEDLLDTIAVEDAPSSEYRPPRNDGFLRLSPIQLRRRRTPTTFPSCAGPRDQHKARDDERDPDTPSRPPTSFQRMPPHPTGSISSPSQEPSSSSPNQNTSRGHNRQYCTQKCLLGLVQGGPLDMSCPNVREHGKGRHQINAPAFLARIRQQLADDLDTDCKPVRRGACGVLFRIRLKSHGYVVAAKCFPTESLRRLRHEATVYDQLRSIQGIHVPVHLGNIDLKTPYYYDGICELVHVMFLSFGGLPISKHLTPENRAEATRLATCSAQAIHNFGVLHKDLEARNMLWNRETGGVMVIDFDRAEHVRQRTALSPISPNRKRKRASDAEMIEPRKSGSPFARERQKVAHQLRTVLGGRRVPEL